MSTSPETSQGDTQSETPGGVPHAPDASVQEGTTPAEVSDSIDATEGGDAPGAVGATEASDSGESAEAGDATEGRATEGKASTDGHESTDGTESTYDTEGTDGTESTDGTEGTDDGANAGGSADEAPRRGRSRKVAELEREGEIAADFLETLLDIADLDGDLEVDVEGDRAAVSIVDSEDGAAPQRLVGKEAAVLEALQELTRLAVQAETGERSRLMLDVAGHRAARRASLVEQARLVAEQVRQSGGRQELEPMSAFERKVVHDEVLAAGLTSESEGEEPNRFVVVLPAG